MPIAAERWTFPMRATAPAMARSAAIELLPALAPERQFDFLLLVSELVTNSVRHAGSKPTDSIELVVSIAETSARVEVHDPGTGFEVVLRAPHPTRGSGWGFFLVNLIAPRWGVERREDATVVWFEMDL